MAKSKLGEWLDSPARWTVEIWTWTIATAIVLCLAILFPALWTILATVYLAVVSNYALVISAAGARQATLAAQHDSTTEAVDKIVEKTTLEKLD